MPEHTNVVVVMSSSAGQDEVATVVDAVADVGGHVSVSRSSDGTLLGLVGEIGQLNGPALRGLAGVEDIIRVSAPYTLVASQARPRPSTVWVGDTPISRDGVTVIAGPCTVESGLQARAAARTVGDVGATILRAGTYRSSPSPVGGLDEPGLAALGEVAETLEMPLLVGVTGPGDVERVAAVADMVHVGADHMQDFALLRTLGGAGTPVLLSRGTGAQIDEWLLAAEYIAEQGNLQIVLCEGGIRSFEPATRLTLDVSSIPVTRSLTHLPVLVDPCLGAPELVGPLTRAGIAVGADGVVIDVHPGELVCGRALDGDLVGFREAMCRMARARGHRITGCSPSRR